MHEESLLISALGKKVTYDSNYNPDLLFAIPRKLKRDEIKIPEKLPFSGKDIWNHYEVSWLNRKGKPIVAYAEIIYDCTTPFIIESKSMKLYFNSFNQTQFNSVEAVQEIIQKDICQKIGGEVHVRLQLINAIIPQQLSVNFSGICLDELDIDCSTYTVEKNFLQVENDTVNETVFSHLLKSNCLVTNQPDWASVQIIYKGKKINHAGLLRYIVSFRNHNEFHEQCIERIFMDINNCCQPDELTVYGRYTRRGGLDINPFRTNQSLLKKIDNMRLFRQ